MEMEKKPEKSAPNESVTDVDVNGDRFQGAAARRQQILDTINATQHAKAALYQTRQDLLTIGDGQGSASEMAQKMKNAAEREKKEWTKLKGSKLKKLFRSAEYAAELKKEEDEYYEAYEWQLRAEAAAKELGEQTAALRKKKDILLKQVEEHRQAQVHLAELYEEIFDGPTPGFPEEDGMEANLTALQEAFDNVQGSITHTYNVCEALGPARRAVNAALEAAQNSYDKTLSNIGNMTINLVVDMTKSDFKQPGAPEKKPYNATGGTLEQIRRCLAQADQSMAAAQRLDPGVMTHVLPQIDPENTAHHSGHLDRYLNAPLTDIIFYQEIDEAGEALATVARVVTEEVDRWDAKLEALREERTPIQEKLKLCQEELYELRAKLFDDATCPPPQYTDEGTKEAAKKEGRTEKRGSEERGVMSEEGKVLKGETPGKEKQ